MDGGSVELEWMGVQTERQMWLFDWRWRMRRKEGRVGFACDCSFFAFSLLFVSFVKNTGPSLPLPLIFLTHETTLELVKTLVGAPLCSFSPSVERLTNKNNRTTQPNDHLFQSQFVFLFLKLWSEARIDEKRIFPCLRLWNRRKWSLGFFLSELTQSHGPCSCQGLEYLVWCPSFQLPPFHFIITTSSFFFPRRVIIGKIKESQTSFSPPSPNPLSSKFHLPILSGLSNSPSCLHSCFQVAI